jgi:hypothetical protein
MDDDGMDDDRSMFGYSTGLGPTADFGELGERERERARRPSRAGCFGQALGIALGLEASRRLHAAGRTELAALLGSRAARRRS